AKLPPLTSARQQEIQKVAQESKNMSEVLERLFPEQLRLRGYFARFLNFYEGSNPLDLPPAYTETLVEMMGFSLAQWDAYQHNQPTPWQFRFVEGGNAKIALGMAAKLGSRLHLAMPLVAMNKKGDGYELTFANGLKET